MKTPWESAKAMSADEKRRQIADQCKVVHHLAGAVRKLMEDYERMASSGAFDDIGDQIGNRTARWMEKLGDMLNGCDAVSDEDEWTYPIFRAAHEAWPQQRRDAQSR